MVVTVTRALQFWGPWEGCRGGEKTTQASGSGACPSPPPGLAGAAVFPSRGVGGSVPAQWPSLACCSPPSFSLGLHVHCLPSRESGLGTSERQTLLFTSSRIPPRSFAGPWGPDRPPSFPSQGHRPAFAFTGPLLQPAHLPRGRERPGRAGLVPEPRLWVSAPWPAPRRVWAALLARRSGCCPVLPTDLRASVSPQPARAGDRGKRFPRKPVWLALSRERQSHSPSEA